MGYTIPETEPFSVTSGDLVTWTKDLADYLPADSWVLTYALVKSGIRIVLTATDNGDGTHLISVAASTTAAWTAGKYHWQAYVTKSTERHLVDSGTLEILTDFATQTSGYDDRTHVKTVLDAIEAVLAKRATQDQISISINGRSLSRTPIDDLLVLRDRYKAEYASETRAERIASGLGTSKNIKVRF